MYTRDRANQYISEEKDKVDQTYRQRIHLMPPVGWMNDPNGFVAMDGEFHLFYQYHPYSSKWGPMHWGHAASRDGVVWEELPVALAPDQPYDGKGCFSGTALLDEGKLTLMYTGGLEDSETGKVKQVQCIAESSDGLHFAKREENPVIDETHIPDWLNIYEFRDPKIIKRDEEYYAIIATKTKENTGRLVLFDSKDMRTWRYKSILLTGTAELGEMWECPDYFRLNGKDVLLVSPILMPAQGEKYRNYSSCIYMVGSLDWEKGEFQIEAYDEIDQGLDFYAPQTTELGGERILTAWMQMWDRNIPTDELGHAWAGCMIFPRQISLTADHKLVQKPYRMLDDYIDHGHQQTYVVQQECFIPEVANPFVCEVTLSGDQEFEFQFGNRQNERLEVHYSADERKVILTREHIGHRIQGREADYREYREYLVEETGTIKLQMMVDRSSIEVFINEGRGVLSARYYAKEKLDYIHVRTAAQEAAELKYCPLWFERKAAL